MSDTQVHVDCWNDYSGARGQFACSGVARALRRRQRRTHPERPRCGGLPARPLDEIGCGDGALRGNSSAVTLPSRGWATRSPRPRRSCKPASRPAHGVRQVLDGETLPEPDDFALAVLSEVVEHAGRPVHLLSEAGRVAPLVAIQIVMTDTVAARRRANQVEEEGEAPPPQQVQPRDRAAGPEGCGAARPLPGIDHPPFEQRTFWNRGAGSLVKNSLTEVVMVTRTAPPLSRRLFASTITTICTPTPA